MRFRFLTAALTLFSLPVQAGDLAEALRVWEFTYRQELQAFRLPGMTPEERRAKSAELNLISGSAAISTPDLAVCQAAASNLAQVYRGFGSDGFEALKEKYELSRGACIEALDGDPNLYPISWI